MNSVEVSVIVEFQMGLTHYDVDMHVGDGDNLRFDEDGATVFIGGKEYPVVNVVSFHEEEYESEYDPAENVFTDVEIAF